METSNEAIVQYLKETYNAVKAGATPPTRLPHVMFQTRPSPLLSVRMHNARSGEAWQRGY